MNESPSPPPRAGEIPPASATLPTLNYAQLGADATQKRRLVLGGVIGGLVALLLVLVSGLFCFVIGRSRQWPMLRGFGIGQFISLGLYALLVGLCVMRL